MMTSPADMQEKARQHAASHQRPAKARALAMKSAQDRALNNLTLLLLIGAAVAAVSMSMT
ncbi:MAG: hypothetical protein AAGH38_08450 [Pseudomonadota bacterium]